MIRIFVRALLLLMLFCNTNVLIAEKMNFVLLKTVDKDNQPIKAESVQWWYTDLPEHKKPLSCERESCSEWLVPKHVKSVTIYALASKVKKTDPLCWDWFEAEAETESLADQKEIILTLSHTSTVCK